MQPRHSTLPPMIQNGWPDQQELSQRVLVLPARELCAFMSLIRPVQRIHLGILRLVQGASNAQHLEQIDLEVSSWQLFEESGN